MTRQQFAIFDTSIGPCGVIWGARGITGVQLPMGSEEKTRKRIRQRNGDIPEGEPPAEVKRAIENAFSTPRAVSISGIRRIACCGAPRRSSTRVT